VNLAHLLLPNEGRLSPEDVRLVARIASLLPASWQAGNLWPSRAEQRVLSRFEAIGERKWDLRFRSPKPYHTLIAARLSGDAEQVKQQLRSALASCELLIVLGDFGLALPSERVLAEVAPLHLYRGDLTDPLLRVDDYPTGVRPILEDLSSLHDVLQQIDDSTLAFHLGIVPALLNDEMAGFLRGLKHLVACMHGHEHGYQKHSKILIEAGDPSNQRGTVTGFDEFAGRSSSEIEATLRGARQSLAVRLSQNPICYIPPNNIANRATGRALLATGFEYVLSERAVPGCELPCIASDFYDRSPAFRADSTPRVASLHATWEADLLRAGDTKSLQLFLNALVAQRERARTMVENVAREISRALASG
jgi:hypothetical protein